MTILFLHGWTSVPGGRKPTYLKDHGHEVINPALPDEDFDESVRIAQAEYDQHHPDVIVGSSRGGAVAMNVNSKATPLVLLCPAWKKWGTAKAVKGNTTILHSRQDDVVPFENSEELISNSGLPPETLIEVGDDHRLADEESLGKMLEACECCQTNTTNATGDTIANVYTQMFPWVEQRTIPFFRLTKDAATNSYENGIVEKDRTGVFLRIGSDHFILTASHELDYIATNNIPLYLSPGDKVDNVPIPLGKDQIALSDEETIDVAAIKLVDETTDKLLQLYSPLSLADVAVDCQNSNGRFFVFGYPKARAEFTVQTWEKPHNIEAQPVSFIANRSMEGWTHGKLKYSPQIHIVLSMPANALSGVTGEPVAFPDHSGIEGISGCGIWFIADRNRIKPPTAHRCNDWKLVAIEHRFDDEAGKVAGTWIDVALAVLAMNFPETQPALRLSYPQSPSIWTP